MIEKYIDRENPREWYNALMDYGAMLKKTGENPSRNSKHHVIQSKFEGSLRQIRGAIVKQYTHNSQITKRELIKILPYEKEDILIQYDTLKKEGFFE